jgi:hypothetical protein
MVLLWAQNCNSLATNYYGNSINDSNIISGYEDIIMSGAKLFGAIELQSLTNMHNTVSQIPLATTTTTTTTILNNPSPININKMDFYVSNINFGNQSVTDSTNQINWSSDNKLIFGDIGVLSLGKFPRRVNKFYYYPVLSPSINVKILRFQVYFQNNYNDGSPMAGKMQIKLVRTNRCQYISVNIAQLPADKGEWCLRIGDNNVIDLANYVGDKANFVIESDLNGNNWKIHENSYFSI